MGNRGFFAIVTAFILFASTLFGVLPARAEGSFTIDVDGVDMNRLKDMEYLNQALSSSAAGIRVRKYISNSNELAAPVRLTLTQMDTQTLIFDKNYDYLSGTFDSGDVYLPYAGNQTVPYLVTLYVGDWVYAIPFLHTQPRLEYNSACTYGVRMQDYNPALNGDWLMGAMLDLEALRSQGSTSLALCASNSFLVGQATVSISGDSLWVDLSFLSNANVEVFSHQVFCVRDVASLTTADPQLMNAPSFRAGEPIDVSGASTVLLYVPMQLSFDSAGLAPFHYDLSAPDLQWQLALWSRNLAEQGQPETQWTPETPAQDFQFFVTQPTEIPGEFFQEDSQDFAEVPPQEEPQVFPDDFIQIPPQDDSQNFPEGFVEIPPEDFSQEGTPGDSLWQTP